ncbi:MAG: ABC transporter permease [Halofilum sp. (in: g-proteobacteria)]|nr:ABC transporter permease [Halofilum sp. (in: g-proteobacteria)]
MRMLTIAARELAGLFRSPVAWVVLAGAQLVTGFIFLLHLESYLQVQPKLIEAGAGPGVTAFLVPRLYGAAAMIHVFAIPLLTMQLIAGERRLGTLPLLLGAPVSTLEIIAGKFLGLLGILLAMVALTALMPLSLAFFTDLDGGAVALAITGHLLFVAGAGALGLYLSTVTREPTIAATATLGILLALLLLGEWGRTLGEPWADLLGWPAPATHLEPFLGGLFDSASAVFFVLFAGLFVTFAVRRLDNDRLQR